MVLICLSDDSLAVVRMYDLALFVLCAIGIVTCYSPHYQKGFCYREWRCVDSARTRYQGLCKLSVFTLFRWRFKVLCCMINVVHNPLLVMCW